MTRKRAFSEAKVTPLFIPFAMWYHLEIQNISASARQMPLLHAHDAARPGCSESRCTRSVYLSWMCHLLPDEGEGNEATRDIMNWFFSLKVSSVLLNYSVSHSAETQGLAANKWLTSEEHGVPLLRFPEGPGPLGPLWETGHWVHSSCGPPIPRLLVFPAHLISLKPDSFLSNFPICKLFPI